VYRRCQIILHLAKRERPEEIATALACDVSTIYRTRQAFEQTGEASLASKQSLGRPPRITAEDERRLEKAIEHEPRTQHQNFSNWTMQKLRHYLQWRVHAVTVWRHVRRLGWRWRRPVPRVASPDRRYVAKARYLRRLRQQARRGLIHLYYADEMDMALLPTISGRWMRQGHQTQVETPGQNAKQYVLGAVNYSTGCLIWLSWAHKNNAGFRQLLEQIIKVHARRTRKIVVVVDNFQIHKALAVQTWLGNHRARLRLYFLPTYSPQLNSIERVWRHCRRNVTDNFYFKTMTRLMNALKAFLIELADSPKVILGIVA
jgi:transposase